VLQCVAVWTRNESTQDLGYIDVSRQKHGDGVGDLRRNAK